MTFTLHIQGTATDATPFEAQKVSVTKRQKVLLGAMRGETTSVEVGGLNPRDAVCLHFADGMEMWMSAGELADRADAGRERGAARSGHYEISPQLLTQGTARGVLGMAITALEFVGIDLKGESAKHVGKWFEEKQLQGREGVVGVNLGAMGKESALSATAAEVNETSTAQPLLIFLHGTASSFTGSFGGLWKEGNDDAGRKRKEARSKLAGRYGERVYALEHRSLTVSPIDNALDLVKWLPDGAELHLVSHSRGGLIGELLCLGGCSGTELDKELLDALFSEDRTQAGLMGFGKRGKDEEQAYREQRAKLGELLELLRDKRVRVTRFVRVACPAMGTTLASGKLDRWLSLLKFAGGEGIVGDLRDFLLAVIKERTDPRTLPGLEAMMPGSALVGLLNLPKLQTNADLSVIAGDCGDKSLWDNLKFAVTDWFFGGDHDLVVNTGSMYGGLLRPDGGARRYFTRGSSVNHFQYFCNADTVERLSGGLLREDSGLGGFDPLRAEDRKAPSRAAPRTFSGPHPIAFVLPGIMGSSLAEDGDEIWLSLWAIFRGKIERLAIDNRAIQPVSPLDRYYGDFIEFLGRTHEVKSFAYDWRLSVTENARLLDQAILEKLPEAEAGGQPIHIVAHSMGGLVARAMAAQSPNTWNRLKNLPNFRLMMLGTPNYGSYQAVRLVVGQYPAADQLALVDMRHNRRQLLELFSAFPGAMELLPWKNEGGRDFSSAEIWNNLKQHSEENWPLPNPRALATARNTWETLERAPKDKSCMVYVAGCADKTACDYRVLRRDELIQGNEPKIEFFATRAGDGTVTWDKGRLEGVRTWYAEDTAHDGLLANSRYFPAYLDLLQTGNTARLRDSEPERSRGTPTDPVYLPLPPDLAEGFDKLERLGGFGSGRMPAAESGGSRLPVPSITIKCGDLAYASCPVCVGHYQGDTMVSAEARLDSALSGALGNRMRMGVYPGRLGSWEIFLQERAGKKPGGALVVGLGLVGELTPGGLEGAIAQVMSDYALQVMQCPDDRFGVKDSVRSAAASFLLIGTGAGGIEVRDSVEAILRGVRRANEKLIDAKLNDRVQIDRVEFLELYQDIAIQAARALAEVLDDPQMAAQFSWAPRKIIGNNGQRRILCEEAPHWWQRLEIVHEAKREELRFIALTNRARAEETLVASDLRLARDFIRQSISTTRRSREISRTLFEMLIPNRLKQFAPDRRSMVLLVDKHSAAFPWEMLEDRWTDGKEPLATVAGMVRQFKTSRFRETPVHSVRDVAYVVGNPLQTKFGNLPGARDEAESVVRVLAASGFQVIQQVESRADDIMIGLHGDAYRILHLAGHGVHEWPVKKDDSCDCCKQNIPDSGKFVSGMVIGDDSFLTAGDVKQMRWVPDLVFINCCHLGNTLDSRESAKKFNYLAANLAVEFMEMGVKAVVAAGWAVDDAAAKSFAAHFYQHMLADQPFGLAVQKARKAIFDAFPNLNTWGAYQCYGDPDFRLYNKGNGSAKPALPPFYTPAELVVELENLAGRERFGYGDLSEVDAILERIPPDLKADWSERADVLGAMGFAFGEFGDLEKAVEFLDKAVKVHKSDMPLRRLEIRANFKARLAARLARQARKEYALRIETLFREAFDEIAMLLGLGETPERYNLCASAWKRAALTEVDGEKRQECLREMRNSYASAEALFHTEQRAKTADPAQRDQFPYSTMNKWTGELLLSEEPSLGGKLDTLLDECRAAADWAENEDDDKPKFRLATVAPDSLLLQALARQTLDDDRERIIEGYRNAWQRGTSRRAFASVQDQFDLLIAALPAHFDDQRKTLVEIASQVRLMAGNKR